MTALQRSTQVFIKQEALNGYGVEIGSTDGSDMLHVLLTEPASISNKITILERPIQTGRIARNQSVTGSAGAEVTMKFWDVPLSGAAGNGASIAANDFKDILMSSFMGTPINLSGSHHASAASATGSVLANLAGLVQHVVPTWDPANPGSPSRVQWAFLESQLLDGQDTQYVVTPSWEDAPASGSVVYGTRSYVFDQVSGTVGQFSFTLSYRFIGSDGSEDIYTIPGCRVVAAKKNCPVGQQAFFEVTIRGNEMLQETATKTALPTVLKSNLPHVATLASPLYLGSTKQGSVNNLVLDFGIVAEDVMGQEARQGRSDIRIVDVNPTLTIEPLRQNSYYDLLEGQTVSRLLAQVGAGLPVAKDGITYLPTSAIHFEEAQVIAVAESADGNQSRHSLTFAQSDPVRHGSAAARVFSYTRA